MKTADLLRQKQVDNESIVSCEREGYGVELLPNQTSELSESVSAEIKKLAILEIVK